MSRRHILIVLAVLGVALAAGVARLTGGGALAETVRARVVADATAALGREVQVDAVAGDPLRGVVLFGVRIGGPPGGPAGAFFAAPRVTVSFDAGRLVRDLARGRGVTPSITHVRLERPLLVLARDSRGVWNYADLLSRPTGRAPGTGFRGLVEVIEGSVAFSDALRLPRRSGPRPPSPFAAHFDRITGTLDFAGAPRVRIAADLVNTDGLTPATARVAGVAVMGEGTFDLDLAARGASVDFWAPYIVRLPWLEWTGGTFDGAFHLLASRWGGGVALDYRGTVTLRDGRAVLLPQRTLLSDVDGSLRVDNLGVATDGVTMAVDASPLFARGVITHHAGVYLDLALRSRALDLRTLQRLLFPRAGVRLEGRAGGDVRVVGSFESPRVEGEIVESSGRVDGQAFADGAARFSYYGGVLLFDRVDAEVGGGRLQGHARVDLGRRRYFVLAGGAGVDLGALPLQRLAGIPTVEGRATGVVVASGDRRGLIAQARVGTGPGQAFGVRFDRLEAIAAAQGGRVVIDRLDARSGPSRLHAYGEVAPSGALDVSLAASEVGLRPIAGRFGLGRWLDGTADLWGRIEGSLRAPALAGRIRARRGRLGPVPFDSAQGPIRVTTEGVGTPGMTIVDGASTYTVAGTVAWAGPGRIDLTVDALDVPAARVVEIAGLPLRAEGSLRGTVTFSGPMRTPQAWGTVELAAGRIEGQRVDRAEAAFRWTGTALALDRVEARANSSTVRAQGSVSRTGRLDITFSASGFDVRDVAAIQTEAVRAAGHVDLAGAISGSVGDPAVAATLTSTDLVLNGQRFTRADGVVRYRAGRLQLAPLALHQDGGRFTLSGAMRLGPPASLDLQVTSDGGRLATLLGLARLRPSVPLDGAIEGRLAVSGPPTNPRASLDLRMADGRLGDHVVEEAELAADLADRAVTLRTLRVKPAQGELIGAGRIDLRGESAVEFGGTGLDLDLLRPLLGLTRPMEGTFDVTLQLTGTRSDPALGLSFDARDGIIGTARFDQLIVQAFYRAGQLHIEHSLLVEDRHRVRLTGTVPVDPARLRPDPARPVALRLDLVDADLGVLGLLTDRVERAAGPLAGGVTIGGTAARPLMEGRLRSDGGTIKLRGVGPEITDIRAEITLAEDTIRVGGASARMGGGEITVSGTADFRDFRLGALALELQAEGVRLEVPDLYAGIADVGLRITGSLAEPTISGSATFSDGDVFVSRSLARTESTPPARPRINPTLDVDLTAGEGVWLNAGSLRLPVGGELHASGTWRQPRLAGEITADRGTFTAFNTTFHLTEGRAVFGEVTGLVPVIEASAETRERIRILIPGPIPGAPGRVEEARVFLRISGPADRLRLTLSSDPPLAQEEITAGLARQVRVTGLLTGEETLESVLRAEISRALFGSVGRAVARSLGLEEFSIVYDFVHPLTLRVGRLLIRNLYLTLTTEFDVPRRNVWALEYRILPNAMFSFSVDNLGVTEFLFRLTHRF